MSKVKIYQIDPWHCMPLLGMTEFLKSNNLGIPADSKTCNGFQPQIDNPILWPKFQGLYNSVKEHIDKETTVDWEIWRSWVISYNKGGWQNCHTHHDSILSAVVCLIGDGKSGILEFETSDKFKMTQGDMVIFPSNIKHWAHEVENPKTVLSFDIREKQ
jgi:hypothetical protein